MYYYLQHQEEVVTRRTRYDLSKAQERAHILEGLLIALDHIDRVIEIIRGSANVVAAKASLIEEFGLSDAQSQAIVDMRLRALTGLERNRLENEYKELEERIAYLQSILGDEKVLLGVIRDELLTIKAKYGDDRKTAIELAEDEFNAEDLIPNEAAVIAMTKLGYIKRMSPDHFKAQNRGGKGIKGMNILDEDYIADLITINNHDYVLFFTNLGRVYQLKGYEIPEASRTARGTAVINLLQLQAGEKVTSILRNEGHESGYLTMATKLGMIKRTNLSEYGNIRKVGLAAISLREGDELIDVHVTDGKRDIIMISHLGQCIRFDENDARATGRVSMGVKGMNLADGDSVIGMQVAEENGELLFVSEMGMGKKTAMSEFKDQNRGGKGIRCYRVNAKTGNLAGVKVYKEGYELMLITTEGTVIRMKTDTIPVLGRDTSGVKLMQVDQENVKVSSIELIEESKEEEFAETSEETVGSKEV
ncbi:MAG: DNA gyrase C-terminal beta-propeller domain-containing protein [Clostridium sp.]